MAWLTYKIIDEITDKNSIDDLKKKKIKTQQFLSYPLFLLTIEKLTNNKGNTNEKYSYNINNDGKILLVIANKNYDRICSIGNCQRKF